MYRVFRNGEITFRELIDGMDMLKKIVLTNMKDEAN